MTTTVYIVKLTCEKFFVGSTYNYPYYLKKLYINPTEQWIKSYKPLYIYKVFYDCDPLYEKKILIDCLEKFGIDNVWGDNCDSFIIEDAIIKKFTN